MNAIQTKHKLDFLAGPFPLDPEIVCFKIGTCHGQWLVRNNEYQILTVMNDNPGNGHLDDVFEWFEYAAKRDGYNLAVIELWNQKFKWHLINKRGFIGRSELEVFKSFK